MEKYLEILKNCPLFYEIDGEDLLRMLTCLGARVVLFDKKYTVFAEGTPARQIGILLSGRVEITQTDYYGNRSIIGTVMPSELFGEDFACVETESLPVSIVAEEPSEVMLIDCGHIVHTCSNHCGFHQQLIYNLMRDLAEKAIAFHRKIDVTSKRTTRDKLLTYLTQEAQRAGSNEFEIPFDRQGLADYLEVERSGLSTEIGRLRAEGILESERRRFRLL